MQSAHLRNISSLVQYIEYGRFWKEKQVHVQELQVHDIKVQVMCNSMIVNSNTHLLTIYGNLSESTTVFDTVFRRAGHSLNHCIQLTSFRGGKGGTSSSLSTQDL